MLFQKLANSGYLLPFSVQTVPLVCKNITISLHPSHSSASHSHWPPPFSPPSSPLSLCFIYLADMQPSRWQLCPSKGTCSWWLFAHLPVQSAADECQQCFALAAFFFCLFIPFFHSVEMSSSWRAACANMRSAWRPEACSLPEKSLNFIIALRLPHFLKDLLRVHKV